MNSSIQVSFPTSKSPQVYFDHICSLLCLPARITQGSVQLNFSEAYMRAATVKNAISGFRYNGIYPQKQYISEIIFSRNFTSNNL
jgi:hypothetical protein